MIGKLALRIPKMGFIYKSIVGILFLLGGLVTTSNAQLDKYLYSRKVGESATDFVERHLTDFRSYMMESHGVIEGFWGDESKGKKIIAFFHTNIETEYVKGTVAIFQPVGDGKNYILMYYEGLGGAAAHYKGVISVFFFDANRDGSKELFVLELGYDKIPEVIEQVDENGKVEKYNMNVLL